MPPPLLVSFPAGASGSWQINRIDTVIGDGPPAADRLAVLEGSEALPANRQARWVLRGVTSNTRYTNRSEVDALISRQQGLSRPQATRAALIPIRKTEAWWAPPRTSAAPSSRNSLATSPSASTICRPLHGDCITVGSSASLSISSPGLNTRRRMATPSRNWCRGCGAPRSGCACAKVENAEQV